MSKGVIYVMTTVIPGLIKIGKAGIDNYENRMYTLENNGYRNTTGLKRVFAIEVDDYDEKEKLLHTIFEKSQVSDTELFALDVDIAIQLLSSFEGTQIYPVDKSKNVMFDSATESIKKDNEFKNLNLWMYAAGEMSYLFDEFYNEGVMAIGWDIDDLTTYRDKDDMKQAINDLYDDDISHNNVALCMYQFARDIKIGDIIIVKKGVHKIIGYGKVVSGYEYDGAKDYPHRRGVEWVKINERKTERNLGPKTLTKIEDMEYKYEISHILPELFDNIN